jgi:hypothetical protein
MKTILAGAAALLAVLALGFAPRTEVMQSDEEALALAERMLETLGGKTVWSQARTIKIELRGYYAREQEPWDETYWMSLEAPSGRFELKSATVDRVIAWTREGGWELDGGELEQLSEERHNLELEYWRRQPVVIFHRLAKGSPATRVTMGSDESRFDVADAESGELLAQFAVNMKGEPIKWSSSIGDREFEHVFGPLTEFDGFRLPSWGATIAGVWRYEHVAASLSQSDPPVSFEPPSR